MTSLDYFVLKLIQFPRENELSKLHLKKLELKDKLQKQKLLSQQLEILESRWLEDKMKKTSLKERKVILGEISDGISTKIASKNVF
jgi:hypothetical protein